jgi:SAM-dependent methyltransferase
VNDFATLRDDYERIHASLDDANLDAIAGIAGCRPAIGRLNYLDDATLTALVAKMSLAGGSRVLDLGCGRGFLGRWLLSSGQRVDYTAVDYSQSALGAVRRHLAAARTIHGDLSSLSGNAYDAVFAIESVWSVTSALAARLRTAMVSRARFAASISSLDDSHDDRVDTTVQSLRGEGFEVERLPSAPAHAGTVGRLCAAMLIEPPADAWVRERLTGEAARTLAALRDGTFRSDVLLATSPD